MQACCHRSQRKNEDPHSLKIEVVNSSEDAKISKAECFCKAGYLYLFFFCFTFLRFVFNLFLFTIVRKGGHCNHIAGLLYTLNHWFLLGLKEIPADKTCTSLPQMWHQPRGTRIESEPIMNCIFANSSTDKGGTRKRSPVTCKLYDARSKMLRSEGWRRETVVRMCSEMSKREKKTSVLLLVG